MSSPYTSQLHYVFDRPVTEPAWHWMPQDEPDVFNAEDPLTAFIFIERLCQQPGQDLAIFSDSQIGQGLDFIFNSACSNLTHGFKAAPVEQARKETALKALFNLFREVFEPRCPAQTQSGNQVASAPLSSICYMFWDVTPLSGAWSGISKIERRAYYDAIAQVMEKCLSLRNVACVESGLHGLGHMVVDYPAVAEPILDRYLAKLEKIPAELRGYAQAARTGMIQ